MRITIGGSSRCAVLAALLLLAGAAAAAQADRGVAVDVGKIEVTQRLTPGGSYALPTIGVSNPGTETSVYLMGLSQMEGQAGLVPPLSWFDFSPPRFALEPGSTQPVRIEIHIPPGAQPGEYEALLQARVNLEGAGAQLGAAAAARLSFTVNPSNVVQAWAVKVQTFIRRRAPWSYIVPAVAALIVVARWATSRYAFRLERRPERPERRQ
jgi:hypothetical protein